MTDEVQQTAAHTPGPWRVVPGSVVSEGRTFNGHPVFVASYGSEDYDERNAEINANARLIAAAPALLEALEACEQEIRQYHADEDCRGGCPAETALSVARAAIRAARGEGD